MACEYHHGPASAQAALTKSRFDDFFKHTLDPLEENKLRSMLHLITTRSVGAPIDCCDLHPALRRPQPQLEHTPLATTKSGGHAGVTMQTEQHTEPHTS
jgi:hypothetical protein